MNRRRGVTLIEVLVAVAVLSLLTGELLSLCRCGAVGTVRAGCEQIAAIAGARVVDRLIACGYRALAAKAGTETTVALDDFETDGESADGGPRAYLADGVAFTARCRVDEVEAGLLKMTVCLTWSRPGGDAQAADAGSELRRLQLMRYVADPMAGVTGPIEKGSDKA